MTKDEVVKLLKIFQVVDGGCESCFSAIIKDFNQSFPGLLTPELISEHCDMYGNKVTLEDATKYLKPRGW